MSKKCLGCGNLLDDNYDKDLCERCFRLKYYGEYQVTNKSNIDYFKILDSISENDLVLYITSIFNINLEYLKKFKNVIIVITKKDILPKSIKDLKIINYIKKHYGEYDIEVISSVKNYNLDNLMDKIKKYNKNKVYLVGNTNSGKSTLLNKIINNYSDNNPSITTSIYPSTTLDVINVNIDNITFIDTPGIIDEGSIINYIDNNTLKVITPKKEIKPRTYQIKGKGSLIIENMIRLDYEVEIGSMTIYISNAVNIVRVGFNNSKLHELEKREFNFKKRKDVVITDLCFIKFVGLVKVQIYANSNIKIYERDNLI